MSFEYKSSLYHENNVIDEFKVVFNWSKVLLIENHLAEKQQT